MAFSIPFLFCSFQALLFPTMTEIPGNDWRPQRIEPQYTVSETPIDGGMLTHFPNQLCIVEPSTTTHEKLQDPSFCHRWNDLFVGIAWISKSEPRYRTYNLQSLANFSTEKGQFTHKVLKGVVSATGHPSPSFLPCNISCLELNHRKSPSADRVPPWR